MFPACVLSHFSCVQLFVTPWTGACQAPLSMGFSRQEYWHRLPCPPPRDLPNPGIKPEPGIKLVSLSAFLQWQVDFLPLCHLGFPAGSDGKEPACNSGDLGSIPVLGRSPGDENDNSLQYSCLGKTMDRGAWWATVHGVAKSGRRLID